MTAVALRISNASAAPAECLRILAALDAFSIREFDLAVYLRTYPKSFSDFLAVPARARMHSLDPRLRSSSPYRMHVSQWGDDRLHYGLNMLEIVSLVTNKRYTHDDLSFPELEWKPEDFEGIQRLFGGGTPGPYVVVHPYAKDETRRYPSQYWSELINRLRKTFDIPFVAIGGKDDPPLPGLDVLPAQGRLSIAETACLIKSAAAFIGNLSGPAHLAAALGRPTVTLMSGHSLPKRMGTAWRLLVLRADALVHLVINHVPDLRTCVLDRAPPGSDRQNDCHLPAVAHQALLTLRSPGWLDFTGRLEPARHPLDGLMTVGTPSPSARAARCTGGRCGLRTTQSTRLPRRLHRTTGWSAR